ncbi:MAG: hypothetical protein D6681_09550, partial [Calditrichaeota bacterium]
MKFGKMVVWVLLAVGVVMGLYDWAVAEDAKAKAQVVVLKPVGNELRYDKTEFTVKAGQKVKLVFDNVATIPALKHNVVILKPDADVQAIGTAAISAGEAKQYIPENDGILFHTPLAAGGQKVEVEFVAPPPGDYPYICTFPG